MPLIVMQQKRLQCCQVEQFHVAFATILDAAPTRRPAKFQVRGCAYPVRRVRVRRTRTMETMFTHHNFTHTFKLEL